MNKRRYALAGSTALLLGAGALALPAVAAPAAAPAAAAHATTLKFHSINTTVHPYKDRSGNGVEFDVDKSLKGAVIGYDTLDFVNGATATTTAWVSVGLDGGTMTGVLTIGGTGAAKGHLTGGTGRFAGAHGTIAASGTPLLVTVTYRR